MANQGSGGSRLPLALPPASQGCSSGGGGSSAGSSGNPPPPRNLQGLLQMAITAGSEEPDPPPEPMSEERRQWLQEAMSAAFRGQREEVEQMKNCLRVLSQPTPTSASEAELAADQQEREGALELLADLCENMDNAADFCQLSGMHLLVGRYLEAGPAGLRWRAAQLIGTCSQNVAAIQEQVLGLGALRKLLRLLDRDSCDSVRVKALFAISCLLPPAHPRGLLPRESRTVLVPSWGVPARLCSASWGGAEKGAGSSDPTSHALSLRFPFSCPHCSSNKSVSPPPPPSLPTLSPPLEGALGREEGPDLRGPGEPWRGWQLEEARNKSVAL
uniref:HSPA (Hsp70) binding protein 1 n=1 Tax=Equus caballus TaxID=9796 RepID=F6V860_HORSE